MIPPPPTEMPTSDDEDDDFEEASGQEMEATTVQGKMHSCMRFNVV